MMAYLEGMAVIIGYFAEPSAPSIQPANLYIASGEFATCEEALITAHHTAHRLQAHSFVIDFADGTSERHVRDEDGWRREDA
jgi:hypothetical protein